MSKENIDVSKCMYFRMNNKMPMCRACNSGVGSPYCEYHKDCYYRQLKRLQAKYDNSQVSHSILKTAYLELQEENERLKARLRPLEDSYFKGLSSIEIAELAKKSIRVTAENRKLEYALQEIREITRKWLNNDWSCFHCRSNMDDKLQDIIDKIKEVIGAEE